MWWATTTFSSAVISLKTVVSWKVRTTPFCATRWGFWPEMRSPLNSTWPAVGLRNEAMSLKRVLLPAPFGPITARISPSSTSKLTSLTASRPPKRLVRSWTRSRLTASALLPAEGEAQDSVGEEQHDGDHQAAVEQRLVLLEGAQQLERDAEQEGADDRPEHEVEAAQEAVEHEVDRVLDGVGGGGDVLLGDGEEAAGDAAHGAGEGEGDDAVAGDVDADGGGQLLVLAQRAEDPAQAAGGEAPDGQEAEQEEGRREDVEGARAVDAGGPRDVDDAGCPLGEVAAVQEGEPHRLGERERDHGEVDAAQAEDRDADGGADGGRDQAGERQTEPEREAVAGGQDGGRVAADHREGALG